MLLLFFRNRRAGICNKELCLFSVLSQSILPPSRVFTGNIFMRNSAAFIPAADTSRRSAKITQRRRFTSGPQRAACISSLYHSGRPNFTLPVICVYLYLLTFPRSAASSATGISLVPPVAITILPSPTGAFFSPAMPIRLVES